jgi:hypothetical protein
MFSLFKKEPPSIPYTDKVWKTAEAATKGMLMMAMMKLQKNQPCLIVTFFQSERGELITFLEQHQLKFSILDGTISPSDTIEPIIYLAEASLVSNSVVSDFLSRHVVRFERAAYFTSHYPLHPPEDKVLEKLSSTGFNSFTFCLSFDDPLLKMFGSEKILPLLEKLGLDDNEAIEHAMVTQSIKRARKKVEEKLVREITAPSAAQWFALNAKK